MKKKTKTLLTGISAILLALSLLLGQSLTVIASNIDENPVTSVSIASIAPEDTGSKVLSVTVSIANAPSDLKGNYSIDLYNGSSRLRSSSVKSDATTFDVKTTTLKEGSYDIYAALVRNGGEKIAESEHISLSVVQQAQDSKKYPVGDITVQPSVTDQATGSITIAGDYAKLAYYKAGIGAEQIVDGTTISGLEAGTYWVYAPSYFDGSTFYLYTGKKEIAVEETDEEPVGEPSEEPSEEPTEEPSEEPAEEPAEEPEVPEEKVPVNIEFVKISFNQNPIYSEDNAYIQTTISVKVTDANGEPVKDTKVYFKSDKTEKSFTLNRETDESGIAEFKHSYGLIYELRETEASFNPVFAFDNKFEEGVTETKLNLVLQQKKNLVLYTSQISGSKPEDRKGKVTGLSDDYEIWGGDVHEYAIVLNSGEWIKPVNGEVSGLRSGTNLIRFAAKVDEATNTYYFHSDYDYFEIPRLTKYEDEKTADTSDDKPSSSTGTGTGSSSGSSSSAGESASTGSEGVPALLGAPAPIATNLLQATTPVIRNNTVQAPVVNQPETNETQADAPEETTVEAEVNAVEPQTTEITTPETALASGIADETTENSKLLIIIVLFIIVVAGAVYVAYKYKSRIKE